MRLSRALQLALAAAVWTSTATAQSISSAASQAFGVGNGTTSISTITITEGGTPTITDGNNLRIRIPAGFNMRWNDGDDEATLSGSAAGKVSDNVSFESSDRVLRLNVTSDFVAGDQLIISGLQFENFTAPSAPANLELVVSGSSGGPTAAIDDKTVTIVGPAVSSAGDQTFVVLDPATAMSAITITDAGVATITASDDIRLRIPTGFNMTWNTAITTATITGSAAGRVSTTVTYESSGRVLRLNVFSNFVAGDQITVSGLQFTGFTAPSAAASLELVISGSSGGATVAIDDKTKTIIAPTLTETANQVFTVGDPAAAMTTATIIDASSPRITTANGIRLRIPASLNMVWNTSLTAATLGGPAAGKVSATVSYEDAGKTVFLPVTSDFVADDQLTISGLQFTNFTAVSGAASLELVTSGSGGATMATSDRTQQIVQPTLVSAANQAFTVGDPAVAMSTATITDNATAPTITAADDIRIRIPAGFNMTWNTALTTATINGAEAAKVSTTVSYEDAGQTLVLDVTADFAASDQISVSGLQYTNFTAVSAADNLELVVSGPGGNAADDDFRTIGIYAPMSVSSAASQTFGVGNGATTISAITVTEGGTPTITAGNDLRIRIPAGFNMRWNDGEDEATLSGSAAGKVSDNVSFESSDRVLRLNVTSNFVAGDQLIISGLEFENFTAPSAPANLELVVSGSSGGPTAATDVQTVTIVGPAVSSAGDQTFVVLDPATAMSAITITDASVATITASDDIRLRIPTGFPMTWNTSLTTATITGSAAGRVSTTVTYESSGRVLRLNVFSNFVAGDQITVSGLQFTGFTAPSAAASLELVISGSSGGATVGTDDKTKTIIAPTLTETANQVFTVGDPAAAMTTATIIDASSPRITTANGIRLRIPASLNMVWNTSLTAATLGGPAAGKVSATVSYEDAGKTVFLPVTSDFAANDQVTVSGLQYTSFTAVSAPTNLQLLIWGPGSGTVATSDRTTQIVQPTLVSAVNQIFTVGDAPVAMSTATITDNATSPTITAGNDLRIRIPAGFNMTWNTALTTATLGGAAAAKVATTVSYEDAGRTLVLDVTSSFGAGDQVTVSGLGYTNFTAVSAADNLELVVSGPGGNAADDDFRTIQVYDPLSVSSAASQTFAVGNLATNISTITITEDGTPTITATNDLRIRIPAGLNMTWNTGDVTVTRSGSASGKVSSTVTYENGGKVLRLNVTSNFVAGDQLIVSGLQFTNFTAVSAADNLELVVSGSAGGPTVATDDKTVTIVAPTLSGVANQVFTVGNPATAMTAVTVTDHATSPTITAANNIRLRIPAGFNMTWDTGLTTATITGSAAGKVSTTVTYANGNRDLVLDVTSDFAAGDEIIVSGLQYNNFTAVSPADNLELVVAGGAGGTAATDDKTITIVAPTLAGASNQVFAAGDPATTMTPVTVTEAGTSTIMATNDIRIRIPTGFSMTWNTSLTTATITGSAAGKVSTTVSYENSGQVLVLDVTADFAPGDQITIADLEFANFTAASGADNLELVVSGSAGGGTAATDNTTKTIVAPTLSSAANQTFGVGNAATAMSTITITDASTATITAANDIRIRIPAGFNMTWNTSLTTATIGGSEAGKVSTTVSYESGGQVLVVDVTANFAASDQITISGLQFTNFTAVSPADNLELVISGASGSTTSTDNRTKTIAAPTISSAANQVFVIGQVATAISTITVTEFSTPSITAAADIRIRIPSSLNMAWNTSLTTATIGGPSDFRVSTMVSYEDGGKTLVVDVLSNFVTFSQITISGLQFANFTAASAAANLELVVTGPGGITAAADNRTKTIVAPALSSAAHQTFAVGQAATAMSAITVTDASTATITATNNIRIRIPAGFNMTWNTAVTTATIGGGAAARVSTTVTYEDAGRTLVLNVTSSFAANDQITASGLQFNNFTAPSPAANLELVISGAGGAAAASDDKTIAIASPTLTEMANQVFVVGSPSTAMTTATVSDASSPTITVAGDIRLRIPAGLGMTWNTALTAATIGGGAAAKVSSTVTYENGGQVLVVNVISDFAANDQITIAGLQFSNFAAVSGPAAMQLVVSGAGGSTAAASDRTKQVVVPTLSSAANQVFGVADPATAMSPITLAENASAPSITVVNDIRVRIPASLAMRWNTSLLTATIGGGAAAKVSTTVSYEDAGKTLVLNVTSDFVASDQITISGLEFDNFTASSPEASLQLVVSGTGGATAATDTRTKAIVGGTMSSAGDQTFVVGQAATAMSTITVTDASTPTITAADDIRIRIPAGLNLTWNTSLATATIGGGASGKVSTAISYEDAGKTLVLDVTASFAAGDQITVSGLQFDNFTLVSAAQHLELVVSGSGGGAAADDTMTKTIVAPTISSAANQAFLAGQASTGMSTITVTDANTATITAASDIRIRIPTGFNMIWNPALTAATIGGGAAAKVSGTVTYENSGQIVVLDVTSDFAPSDQITVAGLEFTNFTAVSPTDYLQLVVTGPAGGSSATDDKTIAVSSTGVTISPHNASTSRLPSNGVTYTGTGTVQNTGSQTDSYDLLASWRPGTAGILISMTGTGVTQGADPDSARLSNVAAGVAASVTVTYSVADVAAGVIDTLVVIARSTTVPTAQDSVKLAVTVVRPSLTFLKGVSPVGTQLPGTDLTYTTTVTNVGTQTAYNVVLVDSLPGTVDFNIGSMLNSFPVPVTVDYSNDGGLTWTYLPASGACGAPLSFDGCVTRIRWTLGDNLTSTPPVNTATAEYITRIR